MLWLLQRACEVQVASAAIPGPDRKVPEAVLRAIPQQQQPMLEGQQRPGQAMFEASLRRAGIRFDDLI